MSDMRRDNRWKERGDELQESNLNRRTPSEWWLLGYLIHGLIGKLQALTGRKQENGDEESKPDDGSTG